MEQNLKRILAAMLYHPRNHGDRFDDDVADDIIDEYTTNFKYRESRMTQSEYEVEVNLTEGLSVRRNKTLGLYDAEIQKMNHADTSGVQFTVETPETSVL